MTISDFLQNSLVETLAAVLTASVFVAQCVMQEAAQQPALARKSARRT